MNQERTLLPGRNYGFGLMKQSCVFVRLVTWGETRRSDRLDRFYDLLATVSCDTVFALTLRIVRIAEAVGRIFVYFPDRICMRGLHNNWVTVHPLLGSVVATVLCGRVAVVAVDAEEDAVRERNRCSFASRKAVIGTPEVGIGLASAAGAHLYMAELLGRGRALEYALSGKDIDPFLAERYGWINRAFESSEERYSHVRELAERIALFPHEALTSIKSSISLRKPTKDQIQFNAVEFQKLIALPAA